MKEKKCIFDDKKFCDDCGKCDICDLDPNKICNNCGKCLEEQGIDTKAIKIDEIIEDEEYADEIQHEETNIEKDNDEDYSDDEYLDDDYSMEDHSADYNEGDYIDVMDMKVEFIDDINGLGEVLEDSTKSHDLFEEQFPGLIKLKPSKYKN